MVGHLKTLKTQIWGLKMIKKYVLPEQEIEISDMEKALMAFIKLCIQYEQKEIREKARNILNRYGIRYYEAEK